MMKRLFVFFVFMQAALLTVMAQKYEPNTKWPYLYEEFIPGTIFFEGNQKSTADMNIHLWGNVLHYVKADGKIYQSDEKKVVRVEIGSDAYIYVDHQLNRIIANQGTNLLLKLTKGDFDAMRSSGGGAYGSSLNSSSARDLSSLGFDLGGLDHPELGLMLQEKKDGRTIPLVEQYSFIIGDQQIEATKKGVEKFMGDTRADALKQFLKENKIKWKSEESLQQLLVFLSK
ncbi:MAG: hypothetical protein IKX65_09120 [Prevotella sp.]|nr:hypothetical protein [Prevotella sp.]